MEETGAEEALSFFGLRLGSLPLWSSSSKINSGQKMENEEKGKTGMAKTLLIWSFQCPWARPSRT